MGEAKMIESFSETLWGSSSFLFETVTSYESSLKRHSTLGEGSISLRGSWWIVERPRPYFSPAGSFFEKKSSRKECFAPLGAVDGAPSTCCAKHSSVNFFILFAHRVPCAWTLPETFRSASQASPGLPRKFSREIKNFQFFRTFHKSSTSNRFSSWARRKW